MKGPLGRRCLDLRKGPLSRVGLGYRIFEQSWCGFKVPPTKGGVSQLPVGRGGLESWVSVPLRRGGGVSWIPWVGSGGLDQGRY